MPYRLGENLLDTAAGGSCNVEVVSVIPHCNGTHTECVGHIVNDPVHVTAIVAKGLVLANLVSITPTSPDETDDSYDPPIKSDDRIITKAALQRSISGRDVGDALIVRTLPNDQSKKSRNYNDEPGPYFSVEAIELLKSLGIEHLLVDFASVDRANDNGLMEIHHRFWDIARNQRDLEGAEPSTRTITEFVFVPDEVEDGRYLLDIQMAPFAADAAPSRPVLFKIESND